MASSVYLAGPIAGQSYGGAVDWRNYATERLARAGIVGVSPMRGKSYLHAEHRIGLEYDEILSTARGITARDRFDVQQCDVVLANLQGAEKVSIGTMVELGWADAFRKPVVVVLDDGGLHDHPFVRQIAGFHARSLDEAIEVVVAVLGPYVKEE